MKDKMPKSFYLEDEIVIVESVEDMSKTHWSVSTSDSRGFGIDKKYNYTPKVGDKIQLYADFSTIRGMKVNGKELYYKTDKQLEDEHNAWKQEYQKQKEEDFKKAKKSLDKDYKKLPDPFKKRLDYFRKNEPNFRVDSESYEMFCLREAVKIANAAKTPEEVIRIKDLKYEEIMKLTGIEDGHSGNTFGCAFNLAYWLLKDPTKVYKE